MKKETKDNLKELPKICVTELSDNERLSKDIFRSDLINLNSLPKCYAQIIFSIRP
ncbi:hypothetical protein AY601_1343 [Pedobacter cryoconitis]|uniref:Uncharacterized protein n=1 Tax=Pedobacter cryoconitis TaxID=188932 RepID=A0A127VAS0_9SPHI|nr:hypothetical protein AY601_1343 [Pedobacter cryoconitis]